MLTPDRDRQSLRDATTFVQRPKFGTSATADRDSCPSVRYTFTNPGELVARFLGYLRPQYTNCRFGSRARPTPLVSFRVGTETPRQSGSRPSRREPLYRQNHRAVVARKDTSDGPDCNSSAPWVRRSTAVSALVGLIPVVAAVVGAVVAWWLHRRDRRADARQNGQVGNPLGKSKQSGWRIRVEFERQVQRHLGHVADESAIDSSKGGESDGQLRRRAGGS